MNMFIFYLTFLMILLQVVQGSKSCWWPFSKQRSGKSEPQLENDEPQLENKEPQLENNEPKPPNIHTVTSDTYLSNKLKEAKQSQQLVVIDFFMTRCWPCKFIEPFFTGYARRFPDVIFLKVDTDEQIKIAKTYNVKRVPTFKFIKEGASESERIEETMTGINKLNFGKTFDKLSEASIHVVMSDAYFDDQLNEANQKKQLVVISFLAKQCEHCRAIAPFIEEYAKKCNEAIFLEVDVDEQKNIAARYQVNEVPTFKFIKNGKEETVIGANKEDLKIKFDT
ncbi:thioredoxin domain-containing protein 2-like [Macrosteles quadrilineatus]|uniref:thioredoxin domain-containing protein 2-like n=1 Tax=Macrosteles quadrilineatus TaxID=74068 RepID=UPI0023E31F25|nr:thioredoxin domain-containing protein 2-like [Macrosteles quadrilineatus]